MHRSARLAAVAALAFAGLLVAAAHASAVVDPATVGECLVSGAGKVTAIIDPTYSGPSLDVGALHCITGS